MIKEKEYFLYRHIRLDKDEPFYIGIGTKKPNGKNDRTVYKRAHETKDRNEYWRNIVAKTQYDVDILFESNSISTIEAKEVEFIKLYGRKDLNTGYLVNLTDGGKSGLNVSKLSVLRNQETSKQNGTDKERNERIRYYASRPEIRNISKKKVYIYDHLGYYGGCAPSLSHIAMFYGLNTRYYSSLIRCVNRKTTYKGRFYTYIDYGQYCDPKNFKLIGVDHLWVFKYDLNHKLCGDFKNLTEAGRSVASHATKILAAIKNKKTCKGFYWERK